MRDLATRLETEGITDAVAASEFGFASTWAMAQHWLPGILEFRTPAKPSAAEPSAWLEYWEGISFALPLLCSSVSIVLLGFSIWGGDVSAADATAVGLGTVCSFLLTGGFVQAMARRGLFYVTTKQFALAQASNFWWIRTTMLAVAGTVLVGVAASAYWDWLPGRLNLIVSAFCTALSLFWLGTGALHVAGRSLAIVWSTLAGIGIVALLRLGLRCPLIVSQLVAILAASGAALIMSSRAIRRQTDSSEPVVPAVQFRDIFYLWPFAAYGILYYLLLFGDRLIAWTAGTYASPFGIMFRGDYETALNLGLVAFVFQVGWVHQSTAGFYREIPRQLQRFSIDQTMQFRAVMTTFYWNRLLRFIPFALLASTLALMLAAKLAHPGYITAITACSLAGFPFLVIGLWNASLLFGLSSPQKAAIAAGWACLTDIVIGYFLSRIGTYHYAVLGFTAGAVVFAILSGVYALRAFRRLDYLYFAASV